MTASRETAASPPRSRTAIKPPRGKRRGGMEVGVSGGAVDGAGAVPVSDGLASGFSSFCAWACFDCSLGFSFMVGLLTDVQTGGLKRTRVGANLFAPIGFPFLKCNGGEQSSFIHGAVSTPARASSE